MRIPKARGKFLQRNWDDVIFFFWGGGFGFSYTKMGGKLERTYPLASTKSSQQLSALSGFLNQKSEPIPWGRKPPWLPWLSGCLWRVWLVVPMIRRWKFSGAPSRRLSAEPIPCPWCGELEAPTHPKQCKLRCLERNSWGENCAKTSGRFGGWNILVLSFHYEEMSKKVGGWTPTRKGGGETMIEMNIF